MPQYEFREMLLTAGQGGRPGKKIAPKGLVIHWTSNEKAEADAIANRNYFENHPQNKVSAHYIVDDHRVVQCLPEDEIAYHCGATYYKQAALQQLSNYPNDCTIGMEICVNRDGNFGKTYQHAVALAADILHRRGWGADRLWRHFDITGKDCPRFFVDNGTAVFYGFSSASAGWERFKTDVAIAVDTEKEAEGVFKDGETISPWARDSVKLAADKGLLKGDANGYYRPKDPVNREELAVVLARLLEVINRAG